MRKVTLITGPPCAGKTTYAREHAQPGDIILDQDELGAQAMRTEMDRVAAMTDGTAWVIRCCAGEAARSALAAQLNAEIVHLRPDDNTLLQRARRRPYPQRHVKAIRWWLAAETADGSATGTARHSEDPEHVQRTAW